MASSSSLSITFQENLLVLLIFDPEAAPQIRNSIELAMYSSSVYREVASKSYDYLDQYKKPPAEHIADLFEKELASDPEEYDTLFDDLFEQRDKINGVYVLNQLQAFVRQQTLKSSIITASEHLQQGDMDSAEQALSAGLRTRLAVFSPGSTLADGVRLAYEHKTRLNVVPLGIKELDEFGLGPARGEMVLFIAPPKRGKTWFLVNAAKQCLLYRHKVSYITLEINEAQIAQRMVQAMWAVVRQKAKVDVTKLIEDEHGKLMRFNRTHVGGRIAFNDDGTRKLIDRKLAAFHGRANLMIKAFPTGSLTVRGMESYLDNLERASKFIPDFVVLDYPDLMKIDTANYRLDLGALYRDLRGLAVERNLGLVIASQSNRLGASAKLVTDIHAGEDFSKIAIADTVLTYTQTLAERGFGLARLFVSNSRVGEKDRFIVLMSQAYQMGQFCLNSTLMAKTYEGLLEQARENEPRDVEESDDV